MKLVTFLLVFLSILNGSCNTALFKKPEKALARVYDKYLYPSDIAGLVPEGTSNQDSVTITRSFIENWVKNQLLIRQAEENLTREQKDFTKQLEDYRNSLIIYRYESELIRQNLDTIVSDKEIEDYYVANQKNFELKDNILQVVYVKTNSKSPFARTLRKLVKSDLQSDYDSLATFCLRNAIDYELIDDDWITFDELNQRIPINTYNPEVWLANNKFVQLTKDSYTYFVHILDYRLSDGVSPLDYERENIRSVILNQRKKQLIKTMHKEIYDQALVDNIFEFYNKPN